jgi:hypothetical protein
LANYPNAPEWFATKDYSYLEKLDLRSWLRELERLSKLLYIMEHPLVDASLPPSDAGSKWMMHKEGDELTLTRLGIRLVRLIERTENGVQLSPLELPALRVHLNAPDDIIMTRFKAELMEARKLYPAPVAKPGRKALNARFDKRQFGVWRNHKIVQVCELLAWRESLSEDERKVYSNAVLGSWLDFDNKKMSLAQDCLDKALKGIPALGAQCSDEGRKLEKP